MTHHGAQHHYLHHLRLTELRRLYWAHSIRTLAVTMSTIFVPIYLYSLGSSLTQIFSYFFVFSVAWTLMLYPAMQLANRIGFNRVMGLSMIFYGINVLMLATLPEYNWPLWVVALFFSASIALYWPQFRVTFAHSLLHVKSTGNAVGLSAALVMLAYGIAPAIGGAVATFFGTGVLYSLAVLLFIAAALPLLSGPEAVRGQSFRLQDVRLRPILPDLVANAGGEIDDMVNSFIWPLFIFLLIPSYLGVGILSSVAVVASISIALYTGRRQAAHGTSSYLKRGTSVMSLTSILRIISQSTSQIAGINFFSGLGRALTETPYNSRYYKNADREPLLPYIFFMQLVSALADVALFTLLLPLSLFASTRATLLTGLLLAIPASFIMRYIRE